MSASHSVGVALPGGGVTGAMYQVGCLAALEESLGGFRSDALAMYVGTSSGASVAAALAGGIAVQRMYRALLDPADDFFPLERKHLLQFDVDEWRRMAVSSTGAVRRLLVSVTSRPAQVDVWSELERFYDSLPAGVFRLDGYEKFLSEFFARRGVPDSFRLMPRPLYIASSELDTGDRVIFGEEGRRDVSVSRAVCASSALPPYFAPVRVGGRDFVDGGLGGMVASVDVAVRHGCDVVFIINPMVPVRLEGNARAVPTGHGQMEHVRDKGFLWVYNQAFRIGVRTRLHLNMDKTLRENPGVTFVLLEPEETDATMFMYAPMNFAARRTILQYGYTSTIKRIKSLPAPLREALAAAGIEVLRS